MTNQTLNRCLLLSVMGMLLLGCASSAPTHFYVLQPVPSDRNKEQVNVRKKMLIGIGPIELPKLLDRSQIVTKLENNRVQIDEFHQWGEPLNRNITRVLARNIGALRSSDVIRVYPWGAFGTVDYRVALNFLQFDSVQGRSVTLDVDWSILDEKNHRVLKNGHSHFEQALRDSTYAQSVGAMSDVLGRLCRDLSGSLDQLGKDIRVQ